MASSERHFVTTRARLGEGAPDEWVSPYLCQPSRSYLECLNDRLERQVALYESYRPARAVAVRAGARD